MSKNEKFVTGKDAILAILVGAKVASEVLTKVENQLELHFKGSTATRVDLDSVTRKNEDGEVVEILCSLSGAWLPANTDNFFSDKGSSLGLRRVSRQAETIKRDFEKVNEASKKAIMADLLTLDITKEDDLNTLVGLQAELKKLGELAPEYSVVAPYVPSSEETPLPDVPEAE